MSLVFGAVFTFSKTLAPVGESPYGPTAGPFSLTPSFSACVCVIVCAHACCVLYQCFLIVSSHRSGCVHPRACSSVWGPAAGVWVRLDLVQHTHMLTPCPPSIHPVPSLTPSSSPGASLNTQPRQPASFAAHHSADPGASGGPAQSPTPRWQQPSARQHAWQERAEVRPDSQITTLVRRNCARIRLGGPRWANSARVRSLSWLACCTSTSPAVWLSVLTCQDLAGRGRPATQLIGFTNPRRATIACP